MGETISFIPTNQEKEEEEDDEQTPKKPKIARKEPSQVDSLLSLDTVLSETEVITDEGLIPAPGSPATPLPLTSESEEQSIFFSKPKESDLTPADTSESNCTSHFSFRDVPENSSVPDQLLSFDVPPAKAEKVNYAHIETPHPEYPAHELADGVKQSDRDPASQAPLPQNITLPSSETTEKTAILQKNEKPLHGQNVLFHVQSGLYDKELKSIQSPTLDVSQRAFVEEREDASASFRDFPPNQPQASCSTHNPHQQPSNLLPLRKRGPQIHLPVYLTNIHPAGPHRHASQTPRMPYPVYVSSNTTVPTVHENLKQSDHFKYNHQQPGLQHSYILQNPFSPETRSNCQPPRSQQKNVCIEPSAVSHSSPSLARMYPTVPLLSGFPMLSPSSVSPTDHSRFMDIGKELEGTGAEQEPTGTREYSGNVQSPYITTDQAMNSNVQDLAEKALLEYSDIMKDLETNIKEGSQIAKETEEVDDDMVKEFTEYLNELCNQKSITEVEAEFDMAFVSSLLSSDSDTTDILEQPGDVLSDS